MMFHKIQSTVGHLGAWTLLVGFLVQSSPPAWGAYPFDPVPARYCSQNDELFWYVQISDTHIGAGSQDDAYLRWAVTEAKNAIDPAFIVLTGDITDSTNCDIGECGIFGIPDGPHIEEWQQYRDVLCLDPNETCTQPLVDASNFFDLPGNHDHYSDANSSFYIANSVQGPVTGGAQVSWIREFPYGKYHFLGLNTSANDGQAFSLFFPYGDNAGLDATELGFIEDELALHNDADMIILFGHHPMDATGVSGDTWIFYGADDLSTLINSYGASTYGYGHTHRFAEEFFTGGIDDETGTPYLIDPTDPSRGIFYFNVNSLGKEPGQNIQITAIDCNGISTITRDAYAWPMVMITAPVDIDLGVTDNPFYRYYVVTNAPDNPIRALAFDAGNVSSVQYRVDAASNWQPMTHLSGPLWVSTWDASGLSEGVHSIQVQATGTAIDTDTINVYVQGAANQPPTAQFIYSCLDLACSFDASGSSDPDGSINYFVWDFGDGHGGSGVNPSHTYDAPGTYTVQLAVTDDGGLVDSTSQDVSVSDVQTLVVHVGDLDGYSTTAPRNRWDAAVSVLVHDTNHAPLEGALVTGAWSDGASGGADCMTDSNGLCTVVKGNLKGNITGVRFTVSDVSAPAANYAPAENHDPDNDSDGTSIQVYKDGPPANQPPVADFTWSCQDLTCSFDASGSTDADGAIISYAWLFGDGDTGTGVTASHTYSVAGTYDIQLTVTDDHGASDTVTQSVRVGQPGGALHIGDLDSAASTIRNRWAVSVVISVHDSAHGPVQSATVIGSWSGGAKGDTSCTTSIEGTCTVDKSNLKFDSGPVTFTVTSVEHGSLTYDENVNHDPDGDSDGTVISVVPPA